MLSTEITEVQGSQQLVSLLFGVFMITEILARAETRLALTHMGNWSAKCHIGEL